MSSKLPQPRLQKKTTAIPSSATLTAIHKTFHLVFVRNKNQHSHAKWWKHLSMLRRSLRLLLNSIEALEKYVDNEGIDWDELQMNAVGRIVDLEGEIVGQDENVVEQGRYLARWIVPRAYLAFSTVVADTQFSALGVVLIAALAQLAEVIEEFKTPDEVAVEVKEDQSRSIETATPSTTQPVKGGNKLEDIGEVVVRRAAVPASGKKVTVVKADGTVPRRERDHDEGPASSEQLSQLTGSDLEQATLRKKAKTNKPFKRSISEDDSISAKAKSKKHTSDATKVKKKKKKERNVIDDMFGGL
ncbi:hypothetical protein KEM56_001348 [Ascosphaera pollenicola]|nr:hypothetical protein KEM56_001348 [Ascosphaera pollenicola]